MQIVHAEAGGTKQEQFFSARAVDGWNSLGELAVTVETVNEFKGYWGTSGEI